MKNARARIGFFIVSVLLILWFLYPHQLFLGMIYEDSKDMRRAEHFYLEYLKDNPLNKKAIIRIAKLYNRMGNPEEALKYLQKLYQQRDRDFDIATEYLEQLNDMHDERLLYKEQFEVAKNFLGKKQVRYRHKVLRMLESAYAYASWHQDIDQTYLILAELIKIAPAPAFYKDQILYYDKSLKKTGEVLAELRKRVGENPAKMDNREDLIRVLVVMDRKTEALSEIVEALKLSPNDIELYGLRIQIYRDQKKYDLGLADIEKILSLLTDKKQQANWLVAKAEFLENLGRRDEALAVNQMLCDDGIDGFYCRNIIWILSDMKKNDAVIAAAQEWLKDHDDDAEIRRLLAEIYLYEKKDVSKISFYRNFILGTKDSDFALDVAFLLIDKDKKAEALAFVKEMYSHLSDKRIAVLLAELYTDNKNYAEAIVVLKMLYPSDDAIRLKLAQIYELSGQPAPALVLYEDLLSRKPLDTDLLIASASMAAQTGEMTKAQKYFEIIGNQARNDPEMLTLAGREMFFLGNPVRALVYLRRATDSDATKAEAWFWASEAYRSNGRNKDSVFSALKVKELLKNKAGLSLDEKRMLIKSEARLKLGPNELSNYEQAIRDHPAYLDLRTDYLDVLLDREKTVQAEKQINDFEKIFPQEKERIKPYRVRLCFLTGDWPQAVSLLKSILVNNPNQWSYRRDLAQAYSETGQWQESVAEYESVRKGTGGDIDVSKPLKLLHENYDDRVSAHFEFQDLGSDQSFAWWAQYRKFIGNKWELGFEGRYGVYRLGASGDEMAGGGRILLTHHFSKRWQVGIGAALMSSDQRFAITPELHVRHDFSDQGHVRFEGVFRNLRVDVPQAVSSGSLQDHAMVNGEYTLFKRVILSGEYRFDRDILPDGSHAYTNTIKPSLALVVFNKPFVTIGYQYAFVDVNDSGAFLTQLNLIPRINAHYLTLFAGYTVSERFYLEGGFFIGEDVARNLHIYEGDLFGAHARLEWQILDKLNLYGSYDFGRETVSRVSGESHAAQLGLSWHWD